jgi:hypothetical protein
LKKILLLDFITFTISENLTILKRSNFFLIYIYAHNEIKKKEKACDKTTKKEYSFFKKKYTIRNCNILKIIVGISNNSVLFKNCSNQRGLNTETRIKNINDINK